MDIKIDNKKLRKKDDTLVEIDGRQLRKINKHGKTVSIRDENKTADIELKRGERVFYQHKAIAFPGGKRMFNYKTKLRVGKIKNNKIIEEQEI